MSRHPSDNEVQINDITMAKLSIKSENQKQSLLFPPSLDELIPSTHVDGSEQNYDYLFHNGMIPYVKGGTQIRCRLSVRGEYL